MSHLTKILALQANTSSFTLPEPHVPITIRPGVLGDILFLDSLQKMHTKQVGWMPTAQFEGKIKAGHVLIAEEARDGVGCEGVMELEHRHTVTQSLPTLPTPVGYCIGNDQYFKRDDVGIIYQINVAPVKQRGLIGATLIKAMFDRAAYGCKLFCCWCAQDIKANYFWESLGFVPLAFRAGSARKSRVHIFWQKRIRAGDTTTPYWFPSQTGGGSIREDRIVLPIPPGTHWRDAKPLVLPSGAGDQISEVRDQPKLIGGPRTRKPKLASDVRPLTSIGVGGLHFAVTKSDAPKEKPQRQPKAKVKNDPKLVSAARELRDRWLEHANSHPEALVSQGKYEVSRELAVPSESIRSIPLLPAA